MCVYIYIYIYIYQGGFPAKRISSENFVYACSFFFPNSVFYYIKSVHLAGSRLNPFRMSRLGPFPNAHG